MANVKIRTKSSTGDHEFDIEVADERVAELVRSVIRSESLGEAETRPTVRQARLALGGDQRSTRSAHEPIADEELVGMRQRLPSRERIAEFITKQLDGRHSLELVARHFLGKVPKPLSSSHAEKRLFFTLQDRLSDARHRLARDRGGGNFRADPVKFGKSRVYVWVSDAQQGRQG